MPVNTMSNSAQWGGEDAVVWGGFNITAKNHVFFFFNIWSYLNKIYSDTMYPVRFSFQVVIGV